MVATQLMSGIPGIGARYARQVADRFRALEAYWNDQTDPQGYDSYLRPPIGQGGDKFYDDNEWIGLAFLLRNNMAKRGDRAAVRKAEAIFDLVEYGWDTDASHPLPGGVYWTQASWSRDRNTISNAPGSEIGTRLFLLTGDRSYLDWAKRMYDWVRGAMLAPNGLYWDHVDLAGTIEKTQWSYNQGVMIGAGALLYRATGRREYLEQARATAAAALDFYAEDDRYVGQGAAFNAIFFANLLQLSTIKPDHAYRRAMEAYADDARARFRDPATGLYRFNGDQPVELLQQSGMVRIEAMLAWRPADYRKLT
jgi:predicted alpha-1,6-mannanase (GH76 family)